MYLRTIFELEEEGVVPLRARIAERLAQSGPTVSQTVARMERDGLVHVAGDRHLTLSDHGRTLATRVMRKHGLAELGLPAEALDRVNAATNETGEAMTKVASADDTRVVILRIGEQIQSDLVLMLKLKRVGIQPGREVMLMAGEDGVRVTAGDSMDTISTELPRDIAQHIFVSISSRCQSVAGA